VSFTSRDIRPHAFILLHTAATKQQQQQQQQQQQNNSSCTQSYCRLNLENLVFNK
jgi:hypothetical protein